VKIAKKQKCPFIEGAGGMRKEEKPYTSKYRSYSFGCGMDNTCLSS